jgi:sugar/nucleoside kinase (ribokinase family)
MMATTNDLQVVGLGLTALDVLIRLEHMPTWEQPTTVKGFALDGGGMVGTAMVAAAKLGARVGYIGVRGNDTVAQLKMQSLVASGVDVSRVVALDEPEPEVIIVYVDANSGERVFCGLETMRTDRYPLAALDRAYLTQADYLLLDGFHYPASVQAAHWMRQACKIVVMDGSKSDGKPAPHRAELVKLVDVLICGSGFVQGLTGLQDPVAACRATLDLGPRLVVQTVGEGGSYTVTRDCAFHTPAFSVPVVDTTGAGDVFHGAYLVGLVNGWDLERIARFATAVSALKCGRMGGRAGIPSLPQVIDFLRTHGIPWNEM